jgi:hypothetical protein
MRVETGVADGAYNWYVFLVGDEEASFGVFVGAAETEVDQEKFTGLVLDAHDEVLGFDIPVDVAFCVQELYFL